jgi:hypothetical protein
LVYPNKVTDRRPENKAVFGASHSP